MTFEEDIVRYMCGSAFGVRKINADSRACGRRVRCIVRLQYVYLHADLHTGTIKSIINSFVQTDCAGFRTKITCHPGIYILVTKSITLPEKARLGTPTV